MSIRAFTFLSRSERHLSQFIRNLDISPGSTTFFALRTPTADLQTLFDNIKKLPSSNVGALSGQIDPSFPFCAAFLNVPSTVDHRVWRSTIPGKEKAQVGRWYSREQMDREPQDVDMGLILSWKEGRLSKMPSLPAPLQELVDTQRSISSMMYFTDDAPEGLAYALTHHFPRTPKLGLTATSTPFVTGRPFTLYESGTFHSSGAAGIAIIGQPKADCAVSFSDLEAITSQMRITSSASNMIYTLDGIPAIDLLAKSMAGQRRHAHEATRTIFLGVVDARGKLRRTFAISAGTLSRGAILLEGEQVLTEGTTVQFMIRQESEHYYLDRFFSASDVPEAHFHCLPQEELIPQQPLIHEDGSGDSMLVENRFIAASEGGFFMHDRSSQDIWHCTTPHAAVSLSLS